MHIVGISQKTALCAKHRLILT